MDGIEPLRIILAFLFVLGLIGGSALLLKRFGQKRGMLGAKTGAGRVQLLETKILDTKRRIIIIKRDSREHLLLLSDSGDLVIESGFSAHEGLKHD